MVAGEQGDGPDRIEEVLARNYRQLRGSLCRSLTRQLDLTAEEFDELYQEAWRDIVKRAKSGEIIRNYRAFAREVMLNKWKMELRSRRRHPTLPLDLAAEVPDRPSHRSGSTAPLPDDRVGEQDRVRLALELIESISDPRRRRILELRLAGDLSATEVQRELGVTERTYRRLLTAAMHDIDAKLELVEQGRWCESRRGIIVAYADGRADDEEAAQATRHLRSCPACRRMFTLRRQGVGNAAGGESAECSPRPV